VTLEEFVRPLYQDLDGASRYDMVERIARIARQLYPSTRELELLIVFSGLEKWLQKPRNISRATLTGAVTEAELRVTIDSLQHLENPRSDAEVAVAAALIIDAAGVRALAERFGHARREGVNVVDVAREDPPAIPDWMPPKGRALMTERLEARAHVCRAILDELGS
jgi:hypothetical protein